MDRCLAKVGQLYEQRASDQRIGTYLRRWWQWVCSGVKQELLGVSLFRVLGERTCLQLLFRPF
ncbi:MAG: hypothetical protein F6K50_45510 [Moorea sp. SIO3I7]|nr:hypothetical protein [Moorena sp. SIO3I7]